MVNIVEAWFRQAEATIARGEAVSAEAIQALRRLLDGERQQHLLYIWAEADRVDAGVIGWNYFGPFESEYGFDPKHECPYKNVKAAMADGWRVIAFPSIEYPTENTHTQLGHEFILERFFSQGDGLTYTPHGHRR